MAIGAHGLGRQTYSQLGGVVARVLRDIEKDVAVHQGRLSKFREQTMAVKTNQELHAIQHQIAFAETEFSTAGTRTRRS